MSTDSRMYVMLLRNSLTFIERTLHAEEYRKAHPEEFGASSIHENSVSGEDEYTASSNATQRPVSPLTPPTDINPNHANDLPGLSHVINIDPDFAHAVQTPSGFSPPLSANEESRGLLDHSLGNPATPACFPLDIGLQSTQIATLSTPYAFELGEVGFGSPHKRRRIEIDPRLMTDPAPVEVSMHHPPAYSSANVTCTDAIDPALNDVHFSQASDRRQSFECDVPPVPFWDISAHCSAFFETDISAAIRSGHNTQTQGVAPQVRRERYPKPPEFRFDEEIYAKVCEDARSRMESGQLSEALLPTVNDLDRFFSGYLECFHPHFPIIHLPSLDLRETPSPLIFAMCSIGAQYRLSRQKAKNLFALAGTMSSYALRAGLPILCGTPKPVALWIMQTRVLLSLCGMFSGKTSVVLRTVENLGLFAIDYRLRTSLLTHTSDGHLAWEPWVSRESSKRLLCGMFIVVRTHTTHASMSRLPLTEETLSWRSSAGEDLACLKVVFNTGHLLI